MTAVAFDRDSTLTDAQAWRAVMARDHQADGRFVFAVRTTGIFCRPACPARRPKRENVAFYADPDAARAAGFRPCRRCKPEEIGDKARHERELVSRACHLLLGETESALALPALAQRVATTPARLRDLFRQYLGVSPGEWARAARLVRFKAALRGGRSVTPALYQAGFGSSSRLYEAAGARLGMTPSTYGKGGQGLDLHFAVIAVPVGQALVAWTDRGIAAAFLGDSAEELKRDLAREFPAARLTAANRTGRAWAETVARAALGGIGATDLPLDIRGTAFQWRVWQALRTIPRGETRSYAQVARAIGRPSSVRAVARACATNRAAVLIPCHRVVRSDGGLGGYRWGLERKKALLEGER
ncbi:MAG TPA: bifunctional DNA-binding transcriptional regulator/O6-methylguanine-DNA methyltransferase Ada [Gemmatimonadales bacterium]|nr:bifunctional DNA-binding transcriptional regulator/O6-methylguanine-DNA methyltransferase Ada [Gemmatimonadales bacterium]